MPPAAVALEGPRVRLRPPEDRDLPTVHGWYADPEVAAPFDRYATEGFEAFRTGVSAAPGDPTSLYPRFVIERRSDARPVGCVGHYRAHPVLALQEVWYLVGDPTARGAGLGSEAVRLLVGHLFRTTAIARIAASADVENVASGKLAERVGMQREGTLRSALFHHGRWHDVAVFAITRSEWTGPAPPPPG